MDFLPALEDDIIAQVRAVSSDRNGLFIAFIGEGQDQSQCGTRWASGSLGDRQCLKLLYTRSRGMFNSALHIILRRQPYC